MLEDQPFIDRIILNSSDDGPRLVYADWLEDKGDCDRAEFIRLQCELDTIPGCSWFGLCGGSREDIQDGDEDFNYLCEAHCRAAAIQSRISDLWLNNASAWFNPNGRLRDLVPRVSLGSVTSVHRGFIKCVNCRISDWVGDQPSLKVDTLSTGCAADACLRNPVEFVTDSHARPSYMDTGGGWVWATLGCDPVSLVPRAIFDLLGGHYMCTYTTKYYGSPHQAICALSVAMLEYGRAQAKIKRMR